MAEGDHSPSDNQEKGTWDYHPEGSSAPVPTTAPIVSDVSVPAGAPAAAGNDAINWTASEFIAHEKTALWYIVLAAGTVVVCALMYLILHDVVSIVVVAILAALLGIAAARKPRIVNYRLDRGGLTVGRMFHPYGNFRSFAIVDEGAFASITLLPVKRFALPVSVYFSPEDEPAILELLSHRLPLQPGELGTIDELMRNLHF